MLKKRSFNTEPNRLIDRTGHVATLILLMVVNLFAPAALHADDTPCYGSSDFNCDRTVNGTDLAFLLSNWDAPMKSLDLDGDCRVGGGDIAIMLGRWGALPAVPVLEPVELDGELVSFCFGNDVFAAIITSDLQIRGDLQVLEGTAEVTLAPGVQVSMVFTNGSLKAIFGDTKMVIDGNTAASEIYVNGSNRPPHEILETLYTDIQDGGLDPFTWAETSQISLAVLMLTETNAWTRAQVSQQAQPVSHGFWCKTAAYAAATAIAALGGAGCAVLSGACAVGSVITIGGMAVPCTGLIALCAGGTFAGCAAAYEFTLSLWGD